MSIIYNIITGLIITIIIFIVYKLINRVVNSYRKFADERMTEWDELNRELVTYRTCNLIKEMTDRVEDTIKDVDMSKFTREDIDNMSCTLSLSYIYNDKSFNIMLLSLENFLTNLYINDIDRKDKHLNNLQLMVGNIINNINKYEQENKGKWVKH